MESSSDCVPTEDAVQALIDFLVYPLLPAKCFFSPEPPSLDQQESVGKQLHAVVLLYNYYHRKQFPHLEFLDFKSFCKLASIAKPSLLTYMKCMQGPKELPSSIDQFSISEKMIWEACSICTGLEMLIDAQILRSWSISKVVVLLVDHTMMNCFLLYSSITQGVWSLIEKDADLPFGDSLNLAPIDVSSEKKKTATDHENDLLQFAFQAVKEKTGILKEELTILERRVAYSLSEEKTVAQLYLMQYNGTSTDKLTEFSIEDIVDSLQGPLFGKDLTPTLVVEYFHLLPYVGILAGWLSRQKSLDGLSSSLEKIRNSNGNLYLEAERPSGKKIDTSDICFSTVSEKALHKISGSGTNGISIMVENASSCDIRSSGTASRPHKEEENYPLACPQPKTLNESKTMENEIEIQRVEKRKNDSITSRSRENGGIFEDKEDFDGLCKKLCGKDPSSRNDALKNTVSRRSREAAADLHTVALLSDPQNSDRFEVVLESKKRDQLGASLRVLQRKQEELHHKLRLLEDDIAQSEMCLQAIFTEDDDSSMMKFDSIMDACNTPCLKHKDPSQPQHVKRRLSEAILTLQSPCQVLDEICRENNWNLPRYSILPSIKQGGYQASATVQGPDFESVACGDLCSHPQEARESAATHTLNHLRNMASQARKR